MTEETKKELVSRLVGWAKRGGGIRKTAAGVSGNTAKRKTAKRTASAMKMGLNGSLSQCYMI